MIETVDRSTGALIFKKTDEEKSLDKKLSDLSKQLDDLNNKVDILLKLLSNK